MAYAYMSKLAIWMTRQVCVRVSNGPIFSTKRPAWTATSEFSRKTTPTRKNQQKDKQQTTKTGFFPNVVFFVVFVFWFGFFCSLWYWFFFVFCCKQPYILCVVTVVSSGLRAGHPTTHWSNVKITAGRPNAARAFVACPRATPLDTP